MSKAGGYVCIFDRNMLPTPFSLPIGNGCNHDYLSQRIQKHEEPCESRGSRTVLWEGKGEIPLSDPITCKAMTTVQTINDSAKTDRHNANPSQN